MSDCTERGSPALSGVPHGTCAVVNGGETNTFWSCLNCAMNQIYVCQLTAVMWMESESALWGSWWIYGLIWKSTHVSTTKKRQLVGFFIFALSVMLPLQSNVLVCWFVCLDCFWNHPFLQLFESTWHNFCLHCIKKSNRWFSLKMISFSICFTFKNKKGAMVVSMLADRM